MQAISIGLKFSCSIIGQTVGPQSSCSTIGWTIVIGPVSNWPVIGWTVVGRGWINTGGIKRREVEKEATAEVVAEVVAAIVAAAVWLGCGSSAKGYHWDCPLLFPYI